MKENGNRRHSVKKTAYLASSRTDSDIMTFKQRTDWHDGAFGEETRARRGPVGPGVLTEQRADRMASEQRARHGKRPEGSHAAGWRDLCCISATPAAVCRGFARRPQTEVGALVEYCGSWLWPGENSGQVWCRGAPEGSRRRAACTGGAGAGAGCAGRSPRDSPQRVRGNRLSWNVLYVGCFYLCCLVCFEFIPIFLWCI